MLPLLSGDHAILRKIISWQELNKKIILFTVLKTWGGAPRPVGSMFVVCIDDLSMAGSVSGGCVEDDLLHRCGEQEFDQAISLLNFGSKTSGVQLPCGGELILSVENISQAQEFKHILKCINERELITRHVCLKTSTSTLSSTITAQFYADRYSFSRVFGAQWRVLIIGAGELGYYVSKLATMLSYEVTVCDPREEYTQSWDNDPLVIINTSMPDDMVELIKPDSRTAILALSHDPKLDDLALLEALGSKAFYVGVLGSRQNSSNRKQRLLDMGLRGVDVERIHGPVGLDIGAKDPAEIAVSIMAEITAIRNGKP